MLSIKSKYWNRIKKYSQEAEDQQDIRNWLKIDHSDLTSESEQDIEDEEGPLGRENCVLLLDCSLL